MGTVFSFCVIGEAERSRVSLDRAITLLHRDDERFSPFSATSMVRRAQRRELVVDPDGEWSEVRDLCVKARDMTDGWFDPWAMPDGYDPTGLLKGWSVDRAAVTLREGGAVAAVVNGGGDVAMFGESPEGGPWRIGVRHPWRSGALAAIVAGHSAVATSGVYERGRHVLNPRTLQPASATASATVLGPSLALCDALATALVAGGPDAWNAVTAHGDYEAYWIGGDGEERATSGVEFLSSSTLPVVGALPS